jgi:Conserved hypothetical protein 2217 (DUF2460)
VAAFPALRTGAVAQYPFERSKRFLTAVYEFVDGSEQRFPLFGGALRQWVVRLEQLDEMELFRLEQFFVEHAGASGHFSFVDPWDGIEYPNCSFEDDDVELIFASLGDGQATIVIQENR